MIKLKLAAPVILFTTASLDLDDSQSEKLKKLLSGNLRIDPVRGIVPAEGASAHSFVGSKAASMYLEGLGKNADIIREIDISAAVSRARTFEELMEFIDSILDIRIHSSKLELMAAMEAPKHAVDNEYIRLQTAVERLYFNSIIDDPVTVQEAEDKVRARHCVADAVFNLPDRILDNIPVESDEEDYQNDFIAECLGDEDSLNDFLLGRLEDDDYDDDDDMVS